MSRLMSPLLLTNQPFLSLIQDNLHILSTDEQDHSVQVGIYQKMLAKGDKSTAYLEKMKDRLLKAELRHDYASALISRLQRHDFLHVFLALEQSIQEAKVRENCKTMYPKKYGFMVQFDQSKTDCYIL